MKHCTGCSRDLPKESFYYVKKGDDSQLTTRCRDCHKVYRDENKKTRSKYSRKDVLKQYGLDEDSYHEMSEKQGHVCYICRSILIGKSLCVDHCHVSGDVRKLLCINCNTGLGQFKDSEELLMRATNYIREHKK